MKRSPAERISAWGNHRNARRVAVLLWAGMLGFDPWMVSRLARSYASLTMLPSLLLPTVTQLAITWLAFRGMRIGLAQPTLQDSAVMEFGEELEGLDESQTEDLYKRRFRDFVRGKALKDEREAELQLTAEGVAYRLLRPGLVVVVAAYWAMCLLGPFAAIREPLAITAIAFTWLAVAVLVLPTMVRMWTQPNEVGEIRVEKAAGASVR